MIAPGQLRLDRDLFLAQYWQRKPLLLRNAVDHAPRGSRIRVAGRPTADDEVTLTISNPCEDLAPEDMANVTDLFWQKDEARTSSLQGGLGLPLVSEVARSAGLGFELDLQDGLFHARLKLPRAEAAAASDEPDDRLRGELS